jgi:hypothetical protein
VWKPGPVPGPPIRPPQGHSAAAVAPGRGGQPPPRLKLAAVPRRRLGWSPGERRRLLVVNRLAFPVVKAHSAPGELLAAM